MNQNAQSISTTTVVSNKITFGHTITLYENICPLCQQMFCLQLLIKLCIQSTLLCVHLVSVNIQNTT